MSKSYEAMEAFRRASKQNDHLHPWVAYREGWRDGIKAVIADLERLWKQGHHDEVQKTYLGLWSDYEHWLEEQNGRDT